MDRDQDLRAERASCERPTVGKAEVDTPARCNICLTVCGRTAGNRESKRGASTLSVRRSVTPFPSIDPGYGLQDQGYRRDGHTYPALTLATIILRA